MAALLPVSMAVLKATETSLSSIPLFLTSMQMSMNPLSSRTESISLTKPMVIAVDIDKNYQLEICVIRNHIIRQIYFGNQTVPNF